jgi:hypothetical protein
MRLVTYDRGGARRLGAWVEGDVVVDLPDAVGHPAFPTTMEALVARSGGTTLDAAREALSEPDWSQGSIVSSPRLLVPILPSPLRDILAIGEFAGGLEAAAGPVSPADAQGSVRSGPRFLGPGEELPWPSRAEELDYELEMACILGSYGRDLSPEDAGTVIFGYTLVNDWATVEPEDGRAFGGLYVGASFGPCVVTADEFDPSQARLVARVDGEVWSEGTMAAARWTFSDLISQASREQDVYPGDIFGSGTYPGGRGRDVGRHLYPGAVVEVESEGIGVLRNRVGPLAA